MSSLDFQRVARRAGASALVTTAIFAGASASAATSKTQPASGGAAMAATVRTVGTLTKPSTAKQLGVRLLRQGLHGNDVTILQGYLTIAGYPTSVDGQYGPETAASVAAFKTAHSMTPANGVAGAVVRQGARGGDQRQRERRAHRDDDDQPRRHRDGARRRAGRGPGGHYRGQPDHRHLLLRRRRSRAVEVQLLRLLRFGQLRAPRRRPALELGGLAPGSSPTVRPAPGSGSRSTPTPATRSS